jgi:hypothetical protein
VAKVTGPWTLPKPINLVSKPPILMESRCGRFTHESYRQAIHPHPTLGESIGMAAEVAHGSCTDVPPARK